MPWWCINAELMEIPDWNLSLYAVINCDTQEEVWYWDVSGIGLGDCATATVDPGCFFVPGGDPPFRSKKLTDEQNAKIDKVSDIIAYQRLNEKDDQDKPKPKDE